MAHRRSSRASSSSCSGSTAITTRVFPISGAQRRTAYRQSSSPRRRGSSGRRTSATAGGWRCVSTATSTGPRSRRCVPTRTASSPRSGYSLSSPTRFADMAPTQVAPGVWRAGTRYVNWYAVDAGAAGVTIVDAGLPGYKRDLDKSLAAIGKSRADVKAVALTHGHIDPIGMAAALAAGGAATQLHPPDAGVAARPGTNTSDRSSLLYLRYPASWMFVTHA